MKGGWGASSEGGADRKGGAGSVRKGRGRTHPPAVFNLRSRSKGSAGRGKVPGFEAGTGRERIGGGFFVALCFLFTSESWYCRFFEDPLGPHPPLGGKLRDRGHQSTGPPSEKTEHCSLAS